MERLRSLIPLLQSRPRLVLTVVLAVLVLGVVGVGLLSNKGGGGACPAQGGTIGWAQAPAPLAGRVGQTWYIAEDTPVHYARSADGGVRCLLLGGDRVVLVDAPVEEEGIRWVPVVAEAIELADRPEPVVDAAAEPGADPDGAPEGAPTATPGEPGGLVAVGDGGVAIPADMAPSSGGAVAPASGSGGGPEAGLGAGSGSVGSRAPTAAASVPTGRCPGAKGQVVGYIRLSGPLMIPKGGTWALMSDREVVADRPRKENGWKTRHPVVCRLPQGSRVEVEREPIRVGESGLWVPVIGGSVRGP